MILVTLGTHPQAMDRVIQAMDDLVAKGEIAEEVIIQAAHFGLRPVHAEAREVVPYEQLAEWAQEASVVVTHGGPGSIMLALSTGHRPIVIPRDPVFGEHVDDHQLRFAAWLATRRPITVVRAMADLGPAIVQSKSSTREALAAPTIPQHAIDRLREIVAERR